jgi:hypothetical protein
MTSDEPFCSDAFAAGPGAIVPPTPGGDIPDRSSLGRGATSIGAWLHSGASPTTAVA